MPASRPTMATAMMVDATSISSSVNPRLSVKVCPSLCFDALHAWKAGHGVEFHGPRAAMFVAELNAHRRHGAARHEEPSADTFGVFRGKSGDGLHGNAVGHIQFVLGAGVGGDEHESLGGDHQFHGPL